MNSSKTFPGLSKKVSTFLKVKSLIIIIKIIIIIIMVLFVLQHEHWITQYPQRRTAHTIEHKSSYEHNITHAV